MRLQLKILHYRTIFEMYDCAVNFFNDYTKINKISMKLNTTRLFNNVKQDILNIINSTIIET